MLLHASYSANFTAKHREVWAAKWRHRRRGWQFGLNINQIIEDTGYASLPSSAFQWDVSPPVLTEESSRRLAIARRRWIPGLWRNPQAAERLSAEHTVFAAVRTTLRKDRQRGLTLAAQLVIRQYIEDFWEILAHRFVQTLPPGERPRSRQGKVDTFRKTVDLDPEITSGMRGLSYEVVRGAIERACGVEVEPVFTRPHRAEGSRFEAANLAGTWIGRLQGLLVGIESDEPGSSPRWGNMPFRRVARRLLAIMRETRFRSEDLPARFLRYLPVEMARYLWVCPQYQWTRFSTTGRRQGGLPELARTALNVPCLPTGKRTVDALAAMETY